MVMAIAPPLTDSSHHVVMVATMAITMIMATTVAARATMIQAVGMMTIAIEGN
jgi:hypothetical protein